MRLFPLLLATAATGFAFSAVHAAEPVRIELRERVNVGSSIVTIGDVATISGDAGTCAKIAKIDLAELKPRESSLVFGKRSVEYRLLIAGIDATCFRVSGAEKINITLAKRSLTVEEVVAAAKTELLRHLATPPESTLIELALPVVVKMPEVPSGERPTIVAKPRGQVNANGRVQMDMAIVSGSTTLLSFAVYLEVKTLAQPGAGTPAAFASANAQQATQSPVIIRPRQRVSMEVRSGELVVKAVGEAMQEGRLGQSIQVQNVDSKKTIVAKVTGPSTVEVDIGGSP